MSKESEWNEDSFGVVINGEKTYRALADRMFGRSIVINWTDARGTMLVILFTMGAEQDGDIGHTFHIALPMRQVMFVSIMRMGCFGFDVFDGRWVSPDYISEKLHVTGSTAEALSHLVNGVKTAYTGKPHEASTKSTEENERHREGFTNFEVSTPHYGGEDDA